MAYVVYGEIVQGVDDGKPAGGGVAALIGMGGDEGEGVCAGIG